MALIRLLDQDVRRDQLRQLFMQERIAKSVERLVSREIVNTTKDIVKVWEVTGRAELPPEHARRIEDILRMAWRASIQGMAERVSQAAKAGRSPLIAKNEDHWELFVQEYLAEFGAQQVKQITETTLQQILTGISIGRAEGLGQAQIAKRIIEQAPHLGFQRAAVIARTEVHSASNYGALKQAEDTGLEMMKEWIANIHQNRTRDTHKDADGQAVRLNEPFTVGGAKLMYPGDPSGPGKETINCRCTQAFIVLD